MFSAPFQVATLLSPMPGAFLYQIPAYLIGEMWIGVCIAVVVDLVPADLTTSSIAVYVFIIQIIGGNMNLLVTPISNSHGLTFALLITLPGFYLASAIIFVLPLIMLRLAEARTRADEAKTDKISTTTGESLSKGETQRDDNTFGLKTEELHVSKANSAGKKNMA